MEYDDIKTSENCGPVSMVNKPQKLAPDQLSDLVPDQAQAEETREALIAICNLAIFLLLWGATSVWGLLSDFSGWTKFAIVLVGFPVWGLVVNRVFIKLSRSDSRSIDQL